MGKELSWLMRQQPIPHESCFPVIGISWLKNGSEVASPKLNRSKPLLFESSGVSKKGCAGNKEEVPGGSSHSSVSQSELVCYACIEHLVAGHSKYTRCTMKSVVAIAPQVPAEKEELVDDCCCPSSWRLLATYRDKILCLDPLPLRRPSTKHPVVPTKKLLCSDSLL